MTALIVRFTGTTFLMVLALVVVALLQGRGEDPSQALAAYARYRPGSPVPGDASCHTFYEYPGAYGDMCTLDAVPYCQRGYLVVRAGVITYTRLTGCDFPAAFLFAQHGRPARITRYRRVVMLIWEGISAQVRHTGWFTSMQCVNSVGWW